MKKNKEREAEKLYAAELARFNYVCDELVKEAEARGGKPYENIELPKELRDDPNYLPF